MSTNLTQITGVAGSQYLTIEQAAELLGASKTTIRRLIKHGNLKAYRYGPRMIRIKPSDIERMGQVVEHI